MKQITALMRPSKVDAVKEALVGINVLGLTIVEVCGFGRQKGQVEIYRGNEFTVDFLAKMQVTAVVDDAKADEVIRVMADAATTGDIGDGKIFVSAMDEAIRLRTGDRGSVAL